jgi:ribonuclease D
LGRFDRAAVDTEGDSLHSYAEKLCLIQVSVPGEDVLIDPLSGLALEGLLEKLRPMTLVMHGLEFDLRMLRSLGEFRPAKIFDTLIAAKLTGRTEVGLAALLQSSFRVTLPKTSQKADWGKRPLPPHMVEYAINDTHYLLPLADLLEGELRELGRREWFVQSCEASVRQVLNRKPKDMREGWRIRGSSALKGRASALLRELWLWRDTEARRLDRPSFHIMRNQDLLKLAASLDEGREHGLRNLRSGRRRRFEEAVQRALTMPEAEWPRFERKPRSRPTPEFRERLRLLKKRRERVSSEIRLDPGLIAPNSALESIAGESAAQEVLLPWQIGVLGLNGE